MQAGTYVMMQHVVQNSVRLPLAFLLASLLLSPGGSFPDQLSALAAGTRTKLIIRSGQDADGRPTREWLRAISVFHRDQSLQEFSQSPAPLTTEQVLWAELIKQRALLWPDQVDHLLTPFRGVSPPASVVIILGNIGGSDAFIAENINIAFDLGRMQLLYGSADTAVNSDRVDRFFAHEFTHVLHKEWRRTYQPSIQTPLEQALWVCLTEGLGNYRSLSSSWTDAQGDLSQHAKDVLTRLQPVLVERLSALENATDDEAPALMKGLSLGPFEEKWGALPVALWLTQEAKGDDRKLQKWVDAGPWGIVSLATKYLPAELAARLPALPE
jgi:hypothetical protein